MALVLNTVEEALDFLANTPEEFNEEVSFGKELLRFETYIDGPKYHSSVPAGLARGLWEFQEELYRAAAFTIYGEDSIRRLTDDQKASLELVFNVSEGSSDLFAPLEEFFKKLGEGFTTMDSRDKARTLVAIVLIVSLAWGGTHVVDTWAETKQKEVAADADVKAKQIDVDKVKTQEDAKTAQFKLISEISRRSPEAARFEKATEEGTRAIIKGASDATKIRVGKVNFSRDEVVEVNQRATKERSETRVVSGDFFVLRVEFRHAESTRVWVASKDFDEFPVTILASEIDATDVDKLVQAGKERAAIKIEVEITMIRNQIRAAHIKKLI